MVSLLLQLRVLSIFNRFDGNTYLLLVVGSLLLHTTACCREDTAPDQIVSIYQKELHGDTKELSEKLSKAAKAGYFYVEMPPEVANKLPVALSFAHSWYTNEDIKNYPFTNLSGYRDGNVCQAEHLICEREFWDAIYSEDIQTIAYTLVDEASYLLGKLFPVVMPQLPQEAWNEAAPGLFTKTGSYFLTFNHYRSKRNTIGLMPHKDSSHVTFLYIDREGLEAYIDGEWQAISPKKGFLVVMFGCALELLVNDASKLRSIAHRVTQITQEDRISFALFAENRHASPVNRVTSTGAIEQAYPSYDEFARAIQDSAVGTSD